MDIQSSKEDKNELEIHRPNIHTKEHRPNSVLDLNKSHFTEMVISVFSKVIVYGTVFIAGTLNFSPLWIVFPIVVSVIRDYFKVKKEINRLSFLASALKSEEHLFTSNTLPSWVNFPDIERCEWFNRILAHMWPNLNQYFTDILKTTVEPNINETFSSYIKDSFKFKILSLGSVPPRFTGIKVYDKNVNRKEIVLDLNIFYAGDCNFSFVFLGLNGGIQSVNVRGLVRIVLKPILPCFPLIGGIDIFFVNNPTVDFNLVGVADFFDLPGLSGKVRQIVNDQIALLIVQPNKVHISLSDIINLPESNLTDLEGVLFVNAIEANDLVNKDWSKFKKNDVSDPYVVLNVGEQSYESAVIKNSLNPKWDFWAEFVIESIYNDTILTAKVMDKDALTEDSFLGSVSIDISLIKQKGNLESWLELEDTKKGCIHLSLHFCSLSSNRSDYRHDPNNLLSSSLLAVYVDSAQNLTTPQSSEVLNSFLQLSVGKNILTSKTLSSSDPRFKEAFTFLVKNPEINKLQIKVIEQKSDTCLGQTTIILNQVMNCENMEVIDHCYPLADSASDSTLVLSLRLRILNKINK